MATQIVKTTAMKTRQCVIIDLVTPTLNSPARTVVAFLNYGCVISTMIVVMTLTNLLTCVARRTVPRDGEDVLARPTTDVFLNGCSAMAKTIVEMVLMSFRRTAQLATRILISHAITNVVYQNNGCATSPTIVVMEATKPKQFASINTESVLNQNSSVAVENAYRRDGAAITRTTVVTTLTRLIVEDSSARTEHSNANRDIASLPTSDVMETGIAGICPTKSDARHVSLVEDTALRADSNAQTTCVYLNRTCATALTTAAMDPTRRLPFAPTSTATHYEDSTAIIIDVCRGTKYATAWTTAVTARTRTT